MVIDALIKFQKPTMTARKYGWTHRVGLVVAGGTQVPKFSREECEIKHQPCNNYLPSKKNPAKNYVVK